MLDIRVFTILIIVCLETKLVLCDAETNYCYSDDQQPYIYANTKTAYQLNHGLIKNTSVPNCHPVQIWMLTRHGTRNPNEKEITNMKKYLPELQRNIIQNYEKHGSSRLCEKDIENLKRWRMNSSLNTENKEFLTEQGINDLTFIGKRFKNYLPELFQADSKDIQVDRYYFRSTDTQRTILSMKSFIRGAFGDVNMNMKVVPTKEDTLLKTHKICKRWREENEPSKNDEASTFLSGSEFQKLIHNVSRRLGFSDDLSLDDVVTMHYACIYERAWHVDKLSPWCAAFTENELEVFEYKEDLHYYYYSSYGDKLLRKIGCMPLQDMFNQFTKLENGDSREDLKGIFYYTHSSMVQLHLMSMGIAEDSTPLTSNNFNEMKNTRKWRTSHLIPFAANFAAVFYKCDSSNKVRFYLNERPLDYKGCHEGVCDWEYVKEKLGSVASQCNVNFCM
ncbi:multiple inositol polyphosphate phosphatase 1 [Calliopsis andreniformis]|uniref:multiple inositol polyphosphate phosphatase 1 n=1 Tax=Calliopsis andreniformis TaxID=337506 RepID=UPI003FCEA3D4